jgi:hypothetical protein
VLKEPRSGFALAPGLEAREYSNEIVDFQKSAAVENMAWVDLVWARRCLIGAVQDKAAAAARPAQEGREGG